MPFVQSLGCVALLPRRPAPHPSDRDWSTPADEAKAHSARLAEETRQRIGGQPALPDNPPQRRDGSCVSCGGDRSEIAVKNGDPFCSTGCAKDWHGQLADSPSTSG